VSGNFTGTTDEILQWAACKWGFADDFVRAMAVHSTRWRQTAIGCWSTTSSDCPAGAATRTTGAGTECGGCYGLLQIRWKYHPTTWPMARDSTAFSADYFLAYLRACFEGWIPHLARNAPAERPYRPDDEWACVGAVFTGDWYDASALNATAATRGYHETRPWTRPDF
jgi:autotransporter family porin